jgi:sec-independent protein translocase protein TatC|tara:strand:- start:1225 stop:1950 length:726 start_codon:yes stop_codon:yes gene_type:complete
MKSKKKSSNHSYISELRKRVIFVVAFFLTALTIGMMFSKKLVLLFLNSNLPANVNLVTLNPYENILLFIYLVFFIALTLTIPFLIYQIIKYVKPSLNKTERKLIILVPLVGFLLFVTGASFGYFLTKYIIVPFLSNLALSIDIVNNWSINQYLKFIIYLSFANGLIFQMPLIISLLVWFRVFDPEQIKKIRKYVIVGLLVLAAIVTPPDFFSLIIMVAPLILLFELSLIIASFMKRKEVVK